LVRGGLRLVDDPSVTFDAERRRMFHVTGRDGRSLAEEQVRAGLAQPDGRGPDRDRLAAAAAEARAAGRGCVWQGQAGEADAPHATLAAALGPGDGPLARGASKAMAAPLEALPATSNGPLPGGGAPPGSTRCASAGGAWRPRNAPARRRPAPNTPATMRRIPTPATAGPPVLGAAPLAEPPQL
ncbi:MAG TPA: hypothetical protein VHS99_09660, partial [Chloroflexota bacterium]|nr:hypothetical protein [Chloroflexota bacterium]